MVFIIGMSQNGKKVLYLILLHYHHAHNMMCSIQAPMSTPIITHPIELDSSLKYKLEIFNQEESNSHLAAVKVAMQK